MSDKFSKLKLNGLLKAPKNFIPDPSIPHKPKPVKETISKFLKLKGKLKKV